MTDDLKSSTEEVSDGDLVVVETEEEEELPDRIEEPAKLLRIASMTRSMLEEVRTATLDEEGRARLRAVFDATLEQLHTVLTEDLRAELAEVFVPLDEGVPTQAEIRVAQAQLIGWLEGLFNGIQAAIMTQQMAARAQLKQIRGATSGGEETQHSGGGLYL
ncbi:MAG: DUF2587 domain-containing protein [bacterium]|nr:DUF2587 domain-containing protein [bacterium]MCY3578961.1 DUF2587 domain-containing protein [bacterium]MCY3653252.1 DUF2587 domain-containing protein [bacterium]MDE0644502.1 DUF2587 domain-containing protein [bacterium]MYD03557.1 DUF2587 domain-containing protein [Acidimicrobiia bacterium]